MSTFALSSSGASSINSFHSTSAVNPSNNHMIGVNNSNSHSNIPSYSEYSTSPRHPILNSSIHNRGTPGPARMYNPLRNTSRHLQEVNYNKAMEEEINNYGLRRSMGNIGSTCSLSSIQTDSNGSHGSSDCLNENTNIQAPNGNSTNYTEEISLHSPKLESKSINKDKASEKNNMNINESDDLLDKLAMVAASYQEPKSFQANHVSFKSISNQDKMCEDLEDSEEIEEENYSNPTSPSNYSPTNSRTNSPTPNNSSNRQSSTPILRAQPNSNKRKTLSSSNKNNNDNLKEDEAIGSGISTTGRIRCSLSVSELSLLSQTRTAAGSTPSNASQNNAAGRKGRKSVVQMKILKNFYNLQPRPTKDDFSELANLTQLSTREISRWFRNERYKQKRGGTQKKTKKEKDQDFSDQEIVSDQDYLSDSNNNVIKEDKIKIEPVESNNVPKVSERPRRSIRSTTIKSEIQNNNIQTPIRTSINNNLLNISNNTSFAPPSPCLSSSSNNTLVSPVISSLHPNKAPTHSSPLHLSSNSKLSTEGECLSTASVSVSGDNVNMNNTMNAAASLSRLHCWLNSFSRETDDYDRSRLLLGLVQLVDDNELSILDNALNRRKQIKNVQPSSDVNESINDQGNSSQTSKKRRVTS